MILSNARQVNQVPCLEDITQESLVQSISKMSPFLKMVQDSTEINDSDIINLDQQLYLGIATGKNPGFSHWNNPSFRSKFSSLFSLLEPEEVLVHTFLIYNFLDGLARNEEITRYTLALRQWGKLINEFTLDYCIDNCREKDSNKCCKKDYYKRITKIYPPLASLQKIEAESKGFKAKSEQSKCYYHTEDQGCHLAWTKSIICAFSFCMDLVKHLKLNEQVSRSFVRNLIQSQHYGPRTPDQVLPFVAGILYNIYQESK